MGKINALTGIRAFAAVWVIFFHCIGDGRSALTNEWVNNFANRGGSAVDLFYVLSGFIMAFVYGDKMTTLSWKTTRSFLWKRFARIYPAHFTVLMLFLAVFLFAVFTGSPYTKEFHTVPKFFYQLFMLNGLGIPDSNGWNFPSWTISSEFFAYLLFPVLTLWTGKLNRLQSVVAVVAIYLAMYGAAFMITGGTTYYLPHSLILTRIGSQFTVGCLLYNIASADVLKKNAGWVSQLAFVLVIVVSTVATSDMSIGILSMLYSILIVSLAEDRGSLLSKLMSSRVMVFFGDISYSIYIIHNFTLIILNQAANRVPFLSNNLAHGTMVRFAADFALAVVGGTVLHFGIEVPARRWLTSIGKKK